MKIFYKGGRGLAFSQREGGASFRKEEPPRLSKTVTNEVREGGDVFGTSAVQYLYPFSSTTNQAQPKDDPRMTQETPKDDPRITQESPKNDPRIIQAQPSLRRGYRQGSPKDSTRNTQETANNDTKKPRLMYQECTANVPLVYGECTGGVLGVYCKGTKEVLRRYYRGTKDIPTACTSPVHPDRRDGEVLVGLQTYGRGSVRNQDVPQNMVCDIPSRRDMVRRGEISFARIRWAKYLSPLPMLLIFICCLFNNAALAQSHQDGGAVDGVGEIVPLQIGDTIPDELWDMPLQVVNHPEGKETITLADYKGKLIILDFWNTWCVPCIKNFPKLHDMQKEFDDQIKVLAVTKEDADRINMFFTTGIGQEYTYLNSVINDDALAQYFPYRTVPHIAWVSPDGVVVNTTQADEVNQSNIQMVLDGQNSYMVAKVDIDRNRPLFLSEHFGEEMELKSYSVFAKGYFPGLPSGGRLKKSKDGKVRGRQVTNLPMMDIYHPILYDLFVRNGERFNNKRIILEVKKADLLRFIPKSDGTYENFNLYNYELIVPENRSDSLYFYMLDDMNRYSDYIGTIEKHTVECLVLVRTSSNDKIKSKGGAPKFTFPSSPSIINNYPISSMVNMLNGNTPIKLPIIDETGYMDHVDIEISGVTDLTSLKRELNRYDLDLIETKRNLDMFVLKDK